MPRRKFDKSNSTTYQVVHRPQTDPQLHEPSASAVVFHERGDAQTSKIRSRADLEEELFGDARSLTDGQSDISSLYSIRDNEGEAAEHGVYYDDSSYDYMQHIRDLNSGDVGGQSFFVESTIGNKVVRKSKEKQSLEDALREMEIDEVGTDSNSAVLYPSQSGASSSSAAPNRTAYDMQQAIPDALAGFQPDMDPRLREVLQALEDEAYIDDEEIMFDKIVQSGGEIDRDEFERSGDFLDDDDGWESDTTQKTARQSPPLLSSTDQSEPHQNQDQRTLTLSTLPSSSPSPDLPTSDTATEAMAGPAPSSQPPVPEEIPPQMDSSWLNSYAEFKAAQTSSAPRALPTKSAITTTTASRQTQYNPDGTIYRSRRRKGAQTSSTTFSMTSSSLARTEHMTLLDARFDRLEEEYAHNEDAYNDEDIDLNSILGSAAGGSMFSGCSRASNITNATARQESNVPVLTQQGFDSILDDFLGGYSMAGSGKRRVRRGAEQTGMEQLDEVRSGLGGARLR